MTVEQDVELRLALIIDDLYKIRTLLRKEIRKQGKPKPSSEPTPNPL